MSATFLIEDLEIPNAPPDEGHRGPLGAPGGAAAPAPAPSSADRHLAVSLILPSPGRIPRACSGAAADERRISPQRHPLATWPRPLAATQRSVVGEKGQSHLVTGHRARQSDIAQMRIAQPQQRPARPPQVVPLEGSRSQPPRAKPRPSHAIRPARPGSTVKIEPFRAWIEPSTVRFSGSILLLNLS